MGTERRTALIVDTDEAVLISVERLLEDEGIDTTTTWDSRQALAMLRSRRYDVLLLAEHPPEINCRHILRQLRESGDRTPTIVMQSAPRHPFETRYLQSLDTYAVVTKRDGSAIADAVRRCTSEATRPQIRQAA
jgi:DNA-binding response OmpR family regulator